MIAALAGLRLRAPQSSRPLQGRQHPTVIHPSKENSMTWEKPQATDMRWGFEITMYIANR